MHRLGVPQHVLHVDASLQNAFLECRDQADSPSACARILILQLGYTERRVQQCAESPAIAYLPGSRFMSALEEIGSLLLQVTP